MERLESSSTSLNLTPNNKVKQESNTRYWILLVITCVALFAGSISSSLLSRFYFVHGGKNRWVSTWVQSAGFPVLLIPIYLPYFLNKSAQNPLPKPFSLFTTKLLVISFAIGILVGASNFLFSWGTSYLPVSTETLLLSTQLAFNLILSVILVRERFTFFNLTSVILITLSSILLAFNSKHDRPKGTSQAEYFWGFFSILGAGFMFALYLPLVEIAYRRVRSYGMVIEMQIVSQIAAQLIAVVGMGAGGGFANMRTEAKSKFDIGEKAYWLSIGFTVICWQLSFMGAAGLVYLTKSFTGGVCMTALLPVTVFGGVLAYGDKFDGYKAISTIMCIWGFCSYVYGEYIKSIKQDNEDKKKEDEMKNMKKDEHAAADAVQNEKTVTPQVMF